MSGAASILLADAVAALERQLEARPQTDLAIVFASWVATGTTTGTEATHIVEKAAQRSGAQQDFQTVAALGFALHAGSLDAGAKAALKQGLDRLAGRQPFVDDVPMAFCSDAVGLLGVALGTKALADAALLAKVTAWLESFVKKMNQMEGTEDWQRCLFHAADQVFDGNIGIDLVASADCADVRVALSARGILQATELASEQEELAVIGLLTHTSITHVPYERAAIRLAALKWVLRAAPTTVPGRVMMSGLVQLLERVPARLRKWTWETAPRTSAGTARQWHIDNEYHVQNFLWLLLAPLFPDLDDEQYLAKIGQKSPRSDLYLPSMRIVIEVKFIRASDRFQKIIDEISSDASLYNAMGNDCRGIVVFIWDDSARSQEHDYLKQGLKKLPGISEVIVVSRPNNWN